MSKEHFEKQEEIISNKYMSASGEGTIDVSKSLNKYLPSSKKIYGGIAIVVGIVIVLSIYNKNKK